MNQSFFSRRSGIKKVSVFVKREKERAGARGDFLLQRVRGGQGISEKEGFEGHLGEVNRMRKGGSK